MISFEDIQLYLPKYLAPESQRELFDGLRQFPDNIDERFYTKALIEEETIFQGDGIKDLLFINLPDSFIGKKLGMILSNTCDISLENRRLNPINIIYAPIIKLKSFISLMIEEKIELTSSLADYVNSIKKQYITQLFYLPKSELIEESIVFLDKINSCENNYIDRTNLKNLRFFSLSNYGLYVLLVKLSIHFMRLNEKVDRTAC